MNTGHRNKDLTKYYFENSFTFSADVEIVGSFNSFNFISPGCLYIIFVHCSVERLWSLQGRCNTASNTASVFGLTLNARE